VRNRETCQKYEAKYAPMNSVTPSNSQRRHTHTHTLKMSSIHATAAYIVWDTVLSSSYDESNSVR
jgi:hypothetical protein